MQEMWIETENRFGQANAMKKAARERFTVQVGQRLAAARAAAGFSQIALAKRLGLPTAANLSNWENGWSMVPPDYAAKIFLLTKVDANYLYLGDASQLPHSIYEKLFPAQEQEQT
jgi:transcriptional regulator with XRE-family HTH domain